MTALEMAQTTAAKLLVAFAAYEATPPNDRETATFLELGSLQNQVGAFSSLAQAEYLRDLVQIAAQNHETARRIEQDLGVVAQRLQ